MCNLWIELIAFDKFNRKVLKNLFLYITIKVYYNEI